MAILTLVINLEKCHKQPLNFTYITHLVLVIFQVINQTDPMLLYNQTQSKLNTQQTTPFNPFVFVIQPTKAKPTPSLIINGVNTLGQTHKTTPASPFPPNTTTTHRHHTTFHLAGFNTSSPPTLPLVTLHLTQPSKTLENLSTHNLTPKTILAPKRLLNGVD